MPIAGTPRNFHKKFAFRLESEGLSYGGFNKCSEIKATVAVVEQYEGGALTPDKSPGRVTIADITLERGASQDDDLWQWFKEVVRVRANSGVVDGAYKRDLTLLQLDRDGTVIRKWELYGAWPNDFVAGDWDNDADENVMEKVVLSIDAFDKSDSEGREAA